VDRIVLSGLVAGGALYVGQSGQISTALLAPGGTPLPNRPIEWTTSDAGKVTVDSLGKVTARDPGTATLTATADGKTATTTVTVISRPVSSWAGAIGWPDFQGNSLHNGWNRATADPTLFREKWVKRPIPGATYNQPTIARELLFLTTAMDNASQTMLALNESDGSQRWIRDFGTIRGIGQPAAGDIIQVVSSGASGDAESVFWGFNALDGSFRYRAPIAARWARSPSPLRALVPAGDSLYSFNSSNGQRFWAIPAPPVGGWAPAAWATRLFMTGPAVVEFHGAGGIVSTVTDFRLSTVTTPVIGSQNDLLTIEGGRLVSVDVNARRVRWEKSGGFIGMPSVGNGVVYVANNTAVETRGESDGDLLRSWTLPAGAGTVRRIASTENIVFVTTQGAAGQHGWTFALDNARPVWSYPMGGEMAVSKDGVLYILEGDRVVAIDLD
jgi:hypothetical protein